MNSIPAFLAPSPSVSSLSPTTRQLQGSTCKSFAICKNIFNKETELHKQLIGDKNIKEFLGKPIIAYSIEIALECGLFDEVIVSTDDVEVAKCAKSYGASVPFMRSEATSNDYASTDEVIMEVLKEYVRVSRLLRI